MEAKFNVKSKFLFEIVWHIVNRKKTNMTMYLKSNVFCIREEKDTVMHHINVVGQI